jgi:uncharacterized protein
MRAALAAFAAALALAAPALATAQSNPGLRLFSLGSASVDGAYHAVARALCDKVNRAEPGRIRCSPEPTAGSLYNLVALRDGQLDFAIVQSDWQKHALEGTSVFATRGPDIRLRAVMSLHPEPFTILARADAGITDIYNLIGKRVDIGHPSSGRQATMRAVMEVAGLRDESFTELHELQSGAAIDALCAGQIDATVLIVGHPNAGVRRALDACDVVMVPLRGDEIDRLVSENDDFSRIFIPIQAYASLRADVPTFAVTATLVTHAGVDPGLVEALVTHTLENLDRLRQAQPILVNLDPYAMRANGLTAPLHPAAEAAFEAHLAAEQ